MRDKDREEFKTRLLKELSRAKAEHAANKNLDIKDNQEMTTRMSEIARKEQLMKEQDPKYKLLTAKDYNALDLAVPSHLTEPKIKPNITKEESAKLNEIDELIRLAGAKHIANMRHKPKINDTEDMKAAIALAEELRKEIDPNFQHYPPATYRSLGLNPPPIPKPKSLTSDLPSDEDTASSESTSSPRSESESESESESKTSSPRKKQLEQPEYYDSGEIGRTVTVEEFSDNSMDSTSKSPHSIQGNEPSRQSSKTVVQQGWATARLGQAPQGPAPTAPNTKPASKSQMTVDTINMTNLLQSAVRIDPDKKTIAITDALISAKNNLRDNNTRPADALKEIIDSIGTKKAIKGVTVLVLNKKESNFLKEFMKSPSLQDVIKDRVSLALLQDMAQSLPRNKRDMILAPLESAKNTTPTPTKK